MNGFLFLDKYLVGSQVGDDQLLRLLLHRPHHCRRGTLRPHLLLRRRRRLRLQLHVRVRLRLGLPFVIIILFLSFIGEIC